MPERLYPNPDTTLAIAGCLNCSGGTDRPSLSSQSQCRKPLRSHATRMLSGQRGAPLACFSFDAAVNKRKVDGSVAGNLKPACEFQALLSRDAVAVSLEHDKDGANLLGTRPQKLRSKMEISVVRRNQWDGMSCSAERICITFWYAKGLC